MGRIGWNEIPFVLNSVYVMRANNRYSIMPYPAAGADSPSVPDGTVPFAVAYSEATFGYAATESDTGGFVSQDIYVPESDIMMGDTGTPGDVNHTGRMALVVGGFYDGSETETFYRIDFAVNKQLINVLRNHLYEFSISQVSGPGFPDVKTAYESQSMNMTVNINDWDAVDMREIFLDGTSYVMLGNSVNYKGDERMAMVYRSVGSEDMIEMRTNIPLDEFVLTLDNGGALLDTDDPLVVANDRFNVELRTDESGNYFVFTALQPYDAEASDNPSVLTVTTGRITFPITITQVDGDPGDWIDGGDIDRTL